MHFIASIKNPKNWTQILNPTFGLKLQIQNLLFDGTDIIIQEIISKIKGNTNQHSIVYILEFLSLHRDGSRI